MSDQPSRQPIHPRPQTAVLFVTCLVDQFRPQVADAVVEVLGRAGVGIEVPRNQTCCGQPAFNSGFRKEAREVASRFLDIFDRPDAGPDTCQDAGNAPIVAPSGSCAAMVRNYYQVLFRDDPAELERTNRVCERLWEFSELLADGLGLPNTADAGEPPDQSPVTSSEQSAESPYPANAPQETAKPPAPTELITAPTQPNTDPDTGAQSITYHRCCHALRELGIDRQPEALLGSMNNIERRPLERSEVCCGFGGAFSVKMPDISTAMLDEKLDNVEATGAESLVAGDTGCIMHMEGGLRRRGSNVRVLHIAELLAERTGNLTQGSRPDASAATTAAPVAQLSVEPTPQPADSGEAQL